MRPNVSQECIKLTEEEKQDFFSFVNKAEDCWLWKGELSKAGYGQWRIRGRLIMAYRASFIFLHYTTLEEVNAMKGFCVCHKCGIKSCVNPKHLYLGTNKDNAQDWLRHGHPDSYFAQFLTKEQITEIIANYPYTPNKILAKRFNVPNKVIYNLANSYKVFKFKSVKLSPLDVVENNKDDIIKLFRTTSIKDIAKLYNVPKSAIYRLIFAPIN